MAKTLNELAVDLKSLIIELNSDAHNRVNFRPVRYNNLKMEMNIEEETCPFIAISIGMSEAKYNLNTLEKIKGSLGADEKYVQRWFNKTGVLESLKDNYKLRLTNREKITDREEK